MALISSEFARVYGIEFSDVLTRGSQFRVESMMFRLAVPENYVMISPSRQQVFIILVIVGCRYECTGRIAIGYGTE